MAACYQRAGSRMLFSETVALCRHHVLFPETFLSSSAERGRLGAIYEQLLHINVQRFRGRLVFKAHRLVYHSTLGLRVMKKKKK